MSLTKEDLKRIGDLIAASEERVYRRIKDNALGEITKRLDSISEDLGTISEDLGTMAEDVAKITVIEGEIRLMDENIQALRDHAGI